jgi:hypothetical protein
MPSRKAVLKAASDLEEMAADMKELVEVLRCPSVQYPYAHVYEMRHRLGRIVSSLGAGVPGINEMKVAEDWDNSLEIGALNLDA